MAISSQTSTTQTAVDDHSTPESWVRRRRSSRINGMNSGAAVAVERRRVRLFQGASAHNNTKSKRKRDNNDENEPSLGVVPADEKSFDDEGSIVPLALTEKRITRSSSNSSCHRVSDNTDSTVVDGKTARKSKGGIATIASTPIRGTHAIPVTPDQLSDNDDGGSDNSARSSETRKTVTKNDSPTKATDYVKVNPKKKLATTKTKTKTKKKKKAVRSTPLWPTPNGWRETYALVQELRKDKTAPCDYMGAEALVVPLPCKDEDGDESVLLEDYDKTARFQTLIALMLSSQTKDAMVGKAMQNLRDTSDGSGGLTVLSILAMDPEVLNSKIFSVGFRNNKTKYIKQVAQILHDEHNGDIPSTADEMIRNLPGIGPKMAYIIENICWNKQTGIGVDTHMQRLFPKIGWVSPNTKNPEQTRKQLESWLPHEFWGEVNLLWVGFGQEVQQEKQKSLRKALQSSHPSEALNLLKSIEFDIRKEWDLMLSLSSSSLDEDSSSLDEETNGDLPWRDDNEREKINKMIEEVLSKG
eukprot:CAMPEP_0168233944 /NCGR_PEP_ID=MMETSP0140_2-20121125/17993_1 /TAXON_ID=44445 /ORGANISM="Pseudo-nitzschia australis, Strain 10249 10 AB" /LENGTH=526 /DNA_ID=CAMNT_0008166685 /DNA_START=238 /DNA_END=1818 /DNA_ORIENTATION=-